MTIDYQHPLVRGMKEVYRKGHEAQDEISSTFNSGGFGWEERRRKTIGIARKELNEALTQIPELINKMKVAEDLPEDERNYYVSFMGEHLENIQRWFDRLSKD